MTEASPTAREALHCTLDADFEDAVLEVQLEHELAGFETVAVSRLDEMIEGMLDESVARTALLIVCHPVIARDALAIDPRLAGLLPCTTAIYERTDPGDDRVHVHHVSATKAIRDLGVAPAETAAAVEDLVDRTGEYVATVWENLQTHAGADA
ncbi:MAG: DUF302 domain-containing protein [Halobacteriaceae archaeon]